MEGHRESRKNKDKEEKLRDGRKEDGRREEGKKRRTGRRTVGQIDTWTDAPVDRRKEGRKEWREGGRQE